MVDVVGRERDLAAVGRLLRRHGRCLLVGPGGVGKTTLLAATITAVDRPVVKVDAAEADGPGWVLDRLAEAIDVDHLLPRDDDARSRRIVAHRLTATDVGLIVIDHTEGHTDAIIDLLDDVVPGDLSLAALIASREHPRLPRFPVLVIPPLGILRTSDREAAGETLFRHAYKAAGGDAAALAGVAPEKLAAILAGTGGLPLALQVAAARAAILGPGLLATESAAAGTAVELGPVGTTLQKSLQDLDVALQVFHAIGVFHSHPAIGDVAAVASLEEHRAAAGLEILARRSLVTSTAGRAQMLPPVRQLARWHAREAGRLEHLQRAHARWAAGLARRRPPPSTDDVTAVEVDLSQALAGLLGAGELDDAAAIATLLDDALRADLRHRRRLEILEPVLDACLRAAERQDPSAVDADRAVAVLRLTAMALADVAGGRSALELLTRADPLLARCGDPGMHGARIAAVRAALAFEAGDLRTARRAATAAVGSSRDNGDAIAHHGARKTLADVALDSGDVAQAIALARQVVREAPAHLPWLRAYAAATIAAAELERGAIAVAQAAARSLAEEAAANGDVDLAVEAEWLAAMADPTAPSLAAPALLGDRQGTSTLHIQADIARALRAIAAGNAEAAIALAADCELRAAALPMVPLMIDAQLLVGDAATTLHATAEAMRAHRQALSTALAHGLRLRVPDALEGISAAAAPERTAAAAGSESSRGLQLRAAAAAIRADLGVVARPRPWRRHRSGSVQPPRGWVRDGDLLEDARRVALSLATPAPDDAPRRSIVDVLSPAERVVADLVADGATNREVAARLHLSRRTVETHLAHAFQKLEVRSRTQLAAIVLRERA